MKINEIEKSVLKIEKNLSEKIRDSKIQHKQFIIQFSLTIVSIISLALNVFFSISSINIAQKDIQTRNRPYLQIGTPNFQFYNSEVTKLGYPISSTTQIKYFKIDSNIINHGTIPAEVIEITMNIPSANYIYTTSTDITIYKEQPAISTPVKITEAAYLEKLNESGLKTIFKMKYKIMDTNKIFEVYNESTCVFRVLEKNAEINCEPISSGTT